MCTDSRCDCNHFPVTLVSALFNHDRGHRSGHSAQSRNSGCSRSLADARSGAWRSESRLSLPHDIQRFQAFPSPRQSGGSKGSLRRLHFMRPFAPCFADSPASPRVKVLRQWRLTPAHLDPDDYDVWLDPGMKDVAAASEMLKPYDASLMRCYPISTRINHVTNDDEECSAPVELAQIQNRLFA